METIFILTVVTLVVVFLISYHSRVLRLKTQIVTLNRDLKIANINAKMYHEMFDIKDSECNSLYNEYERILKINKSHISGSKTNLELNEEKADEIVSHTKNYIDQTNQYLKKVSDSLK